MVKKSMMFIMGILGSLILVQFFYGGSPDDGLSKSEFEVVAHRGVHVNWQKGTYDPASGCEALHIYQPTHEYIENTIESIATAFEMGAAIVEIDVRRSNDNHLVVYHDWRLDCRTDGTGEVSNHSLEYLKQLDIGYGYTADNGKTYPFRGKGVGKMPTFIEVMQKFPDKKFLIDHKDGSRETAELLVEIIKSLPADQQKRLYYWGPPKIYEYINREIPSVTPLLGNRTQIKECLIPYLLTAGLGGFPNACSGVGVAMPVQYVRFIPGWPYRFLRKMSEADMKFYLMIDTEEEAQAFGGLPVDGIVTDYIEVVGKHYISQ